MKAQPSAPLNTELKLIECPRDAMQGWRNFIPTEQKITYINQLLKVGFDTIDFGSFVSPRMIPQMADTKEVIAGLRLENSISKLLCIIANVRGAERAVTFEKISYLGFPFSVSSTFQNRNANSTVPESLERVKEIKRLCELNGKELVVYISMAFGNPYEDEYSEEIVLEWINILVGEGVKILSLSDTVGVADPGQIASLVQKVITRFPGVETGVHLHSTRVNWKEKIDAALNNGCLRFDGALKGIGGCPMAKDDLVGNMDSELMIPYFERLGYLKNFDNEALKKAIDMAAGIFI